MWAKTTSSRDNWERLVAAVIKRDQIRQLCHQDSISTVDSDLSDRTLSLRSVSSASSPQHPLARNSTVQVRKVGSGIITQKLVSALLWWNKPKGFDLDAISVVAEASSVNESYDDGSPVGQIPAPSSLRVFTFSELRAATRNFRSDVVLGEGGSGKVYKGILDSKYGDPGSVIAVKKLNSESMQEFQEWQSEVDFLGRISHPNLIKLLGYCREDKELLLVYEFMQKGSLENHLFGRGAPIQPLPWDTRLKIAIGAARGLAFLHKSDINVIYRDFKASSILLDGSYHAKLSDFGLAKLGPTDSMSHVSTRVMATHGYAAPEYVATGHLYVKSDVYGFGVVLVEMLTGLRALDTNRPPGQHFLAEWIKPYLQDRRKLKAAMDSRLEGRYPSRFALQIAQLAINCLELEPRKRPSMQEIVETLEAIDAADERPRADRLYRPPVHHRLVVAEVSSVNESYDDGSPVGQIPAPPSLRVFTFFELWAATRYFRSNAVLGEGGFRKVYKGFLNYRDPASVIAVKKLNSESMQGFEEWQSEVDFLGRFSHPNLIKLLGYCREDKEWLLVYEFMPEGSLENHLFGSGAAIQPLPWDTRLKIAIGAARGLAFLHKSDINVIYGDFKASNILLDGSYHAKLSDFEMAKMGPRDSKSHVSTRVMGTYGCAAPEYLSTGHLHVKSDVYGFGVVLMEMLTGLRALDTKRPPKQHVLTEWTKPYLQDRKKLRAVMDSRLEGKYPSKSASKIAQLALNCLELEPRKRPSMQEIVETLEAIDAANERARADRPHRPPVHQKQDNRAYPPPP